MRAYGCAITARGMFADARRTAFLHIVCTMLKAI